ncbi:hypothetical protein BDZ91DRAFT_139868 [Kalaharituber pfeilii]|nr:hypothetical protein BDZ91DRAFT_139868 [Kalaharituber pfeilii]
MQAGTIITGIVGILAAAVSASNYPTLPPCGDLCYSLSTGVSNCTTSEPRLAPNIASCLCNDDVFMSNFVDCIVNSGYCTSIQDEEQSFRFLKEDCSEVGVTVPGDPTIKFGVPRNVSRPKTSFKMPVKPTAYTWIFTATNVYLEEITTLGPCQPTETPLLNSTASMPIISEIQHANGHDKRHHELTVTSTEVVYITVTNFITTRPPNSITTSAEIHEKVEYPSISFVYNNSMTDTSRSFSISSEEIPSTSFSTDNILPSIVSLNESILSSSPTPASTNVSKCLIVTTVTHTHPLTTTYISSFSYTIVTEETRAPRSTDLHTFYKPPNDTSAAIAVKEAVKARYILSSIGAFIVCSLFTLFGAML